MKHILFTLIMLLSLCSCKENAQEVYNTTNKKVKVDFLFEVDGIRMYRFFDGGHAVYFTDRPGETSYSFTRHTGRGTAVIHNVQ